MKERIIIASFQSQSQIAVVRSLLESEGIITWTKDELTIQSDNFLANAVGGIKLIIEADDAEKAKTLLIEGGFLPEDNFEPSKLDQYLNEGNRLESIKRVFWFGMGVLVAVSLSWIIYQALNKPGPEEYLSSKDWCLDYLEVNGVAYTTDTQFAKRTLILGCSEKLLFAINGEVLMPGIESLAIPAHWTYANDSIEIQPLDPVATIYTGKFAVDLSNGNLVLSGDSVTFYCYPNGY